MQVHSNSWRDQHTSQQLTKYTNSHANTPDTNPNANADYAHASANNRTDELFIELTRLLELGSAASSPVVQHNYIEDREVLDHPPVGFVTAHTSRRMPPKKSARATLREEGLQKTDNDLPITSWPQVQMINQKNYYTEYLKKDEQYLAYRTLQEENDKRMRKEAWDRARNGMHVPGDNGEPMEDVDVDMEDDNEPDGAKTIIIHPGSQNLRIGLASDVLPKTVPMCIARQWEESESEENGGEPAPKRLKTARQDLPRDKMHLSRQSIFGEDFQATYKQMADDLKARLRAHKMKILPAQRDLIQKFNIQQEPQIITEHNDPHRIDWTEIPASNAPDRYTGMAALRIPDKSKPRYRLKWPIRSGWFNERDYADRNSLLDDFFAIIEDALKTELGLSKREWREYSCCFVIPDLYERNYVTLVLDSLMREFSFKRVCFIQESLAASFGNAATLTCMVDVGAQKTSICCVEDGMCIEDSRMNLKYGGWDITELFIKMMLTDQFPYSDINLKRRYDYLLAEELKEKVASMNEFDVVQQGHDFHLRAAGQDTRKYMFKTFDEQMLAPLGCWYPGVFDHADKLVKRHAIIDRSYDLYDGTPNDPYSVAQSAAQGWTSQWLPGLVALSAPPPEAIPAPVVMATPSKPKAFNLLDRLPKDVDNESTPRSSVAGSPGPDGTSTPQQRDSPGPGADNGAPVPNGGPVIDRVTEALMLARTRDTILPLMPLDHAIFTSIREASRGVEPRMRDFFSTITVVGSGAKIPGFVNFLEEKLKEMVPGLIGEKGIQVPGIPGETAWKGASIFARLSPSGNDSWIYGREYDLLGSKLLAQKCMWNW